VNSAPEGRAQQIQCTSNLRYDFQGGRLRHRDRVNVLFCDAHVEYPTQGTLFEDISDMALTRWNLDHLAHRDRL